MNRDLTARWKRRASMHREPSKTPALMLRLPRRWRVCSVARCRMSTRTWPVFRRRLSAGANALSACNCTIRRFSSHRAPRHLPGRARDRRPLRGSAFEVMATTGFKCSIARGSCCRHVGATVPHDCEHRENPRCSQLRVSQQGSAIAEYGKRYRGRKFLSLLRTAEAEARVSGDVGRSLGHGQLRLHDTDSTRSWLAGDLPIRASFMTTSA